MQTHRHAPALLALLLAVLLTAVYWNHFDNAFQFDDSHTIVNNEYVTDIANLPLIFSDASTTSSLPTNQAYRPVVTALNAVDYWIAGGLDPRVFHWHIYLEFLLLLVLLHYLLLTLFEQASGKRHALAALAGTAFFAFHAASAETVNYIIARSDEFSTVMVLAGFLLFIRNTGWKKQLGLIPLVIGSLAKPTALMLAPLLSVYSLLLERPSLTVSSEGPAAKVALQRAARETAAYFLAAAGLYIFTRSMYSESWLPGGDSALHYLTTQPWVIWIYLKTFILPTGLTADADLALIRDPLDPRVLWGVTVVVVMLAAAWLAGKRRATLPIAFGILWFFICLAPSSSVIPLGEVMNHRRTFLPYMGLVMAATWGAFLIIRRYPGEPVPPRWKAVVTVVFAMFLGLHARGAYQRNEVWDSSESLWRDVTIKSPANGRGLMNYGLALMSRGEIEGAIGYFERASNTTYGNHPYLHVNLGIATDALAERHGSSEMAETAEGYFLEAIRLGPGYPQTHFRYAEWLIRKGRRGEALPHLRRSLALSPAHRAAQNLLQGVRAEALAQAEGYERSARNRNSPVDWLNASLEYFNAGEYRRSIGAARAALALDPEYAPAYNNICAAHNELGAFALAAESCEAALALDPDFDRARANLQWARARMAGDQ